MTLQFFLWFFYFTVFDLVPFINVYPLLANHQSQLPWTKVQMNWDWIRQQKKKMHFCHLYLRSDSFDHGRRRGCGWRCKLRALPLGSTPVTTNHRYRCTTLRCSVTRLGAISPFRGLPFSKMYLDHADQMPKLIFRPRVSTFMEWRWCRPWSQCCISS